MSVSLPAALQRRIETIKSDLAKLGRLRPGTLSQQYNVCSSPGCRCKDDPPQKHGPYYQLSYTRRRKSHTEFIRDEDLPQVQAQLRNYKRLRTLLHEWIDLGIEWARLERQARRSPQGKGAPKLRISRKKRLATATRAGR